MDALLMPPLVCLIAAALGALAWRRRPRLARALVALGAGSLLLFSLPFVSGHLLASLQPAAPLELASLTPPAQAILVLAGDAQFDAPEYGSTTCGPLTLERLRYAAHLARATNLPVCVSGGPPKKDELSHASAGRGRARGRRRIASSIAGVDVAHDAHAGVVGEHALDRRGGLGVPSATVTWPECSE
jgi:uncharacterized SAM-binding protein YcdF (DUF218 family)